MATRKVNIDPRYLSYNKQEVQELLDEVRDRTFLDGIPEAIAANNEEIKESYGYSRVHHGKLQFFHSEADAVAYDAGNTSKLLHEDDIAATFTPSITVTSSDTTIHGNACVVFGGDTVRFAATISNTSGTAHFRLWNGNTPVEEDNGTATLNGFSLNCSTGVLTVPSVNTDVNVGISAFIPGGIESEKVTVTARKLVLMGGFTVSGTETLTETGDSNLVLIPVNAEYTVPVVSVRAELSYGGSSASSDAYLSVALDSLQNLRLKATVISIPAATREYSLLITATDAKGNVYTQTETLTVQSIPVSSFAISGDETIIAAGTYAYTIGSILPANYNRGIASLAASVNTSYGGNIIVSANGVAGATLTVSSMPSNTMEVTLTITATLEGGGTVSATKTVRLKVVPTGFVDLGLPSGTLWAEGNITKDGQGNYIIGTPTEPGCFYSWGNVDGHLLSGTRFVDGVHFAESEYYPDSPGCSLRASIASNDASHDAVLAALGTPYRMPTKAEFEELLANCDAEYVQVDSRNGIRFTSRVNNSSIFLPACGWANGGNDVAKPNEFTQYWSSTFYQVDENDKVYAYGFKGLTDGSREVGYHRGSQGFPMRAVV